MDPDDIRRRIRAARSLAAPTPAELERNDNTNRGITVEELAVRLAPEWDVGAKTLGAIERGERSVRPMELRVIAAACELPYEFFTTNFDRLSELAASDPTTAALTIFEDTSARLQDALRRLEDASLIQRAGGSPPEPPGELGRRVQEPTPSAQPTGPRRIPAEEDPQRGRAQ